MNNRKIALIIIIALFLAAAATTAEAKITVTIGLLNQNGNPLTDNTVLPVGTAINITARYQNTNPYYANAILTVYYSPNNITYTYKATLYSSTLGYNKTINVGPYPLTDIGYYEFRWTCTENPPAYALRSTAGCSNGSAQTRTYLNNVVPEPAPVIGALLAVLALGIFFFKKNTKSPKIN
jgi:hypothetical protein